MVRSLGKTGDLLVCCLLVVIIPQAATWSAGRAMPMLEHFDPHGAFAWATVHHLCQLILTLAAVPLLGMSFRQAGFNLRHRPRSWALLRGFLIYFIGFVTVGHVILYFTSPPPDFGRPLTGSSVAGELLFKALLSGTAEEPLFRGLVMMLLYRSWRGRCRCGGLWISHAGIWATALFTLAHIGFTIVPPTVTWFSPIQMLQAALLGLFYAIAFDRTRSLLTPILAHNFANVYLTGIGMAWATWG